MASGTSSPWYQAVWKHVEILAVSLKATPNAESSLLERFQVNGWIGTTSTAQVDELVTLALSRIESDVKEYDVFMKMLNSIPGMDVATGKITGMSNFSSGYFLWVAITIIPFLYRTICSFPSSRFCHCHYSFAR